MKTRGSVFENRPSKEGPWMKTRITRGCSSPTNRAPKFEGELSGNIDCPTNMLTYLQWVVKKSGIKLRFLAKWDEYPDTYTWLIP